MFFTKNNFFLNNFVYIFLLICPLYLWGIKIATIEARHLIIFLIFPLIYHNKFNQRDYLIILFCFILFIHNIFFVEKTQITNSILIFIYLALIIKIMEQNYKRFLKLISKQINFFLILFVLSSVLISLFYQYRFNYFYSHCVIGCFSMFKLFFLENSHLGMIANSIILYSLFSYSINQNKINSIIFLIFILICILNYSLTLAISLIFNCIFISTFFWKKINRKFLIFLILTSIFSLSLILNNKLYLVKIQSIIDPIRNLLFYQEKNKSSKNEIKNEEKKTETLQAKNLSSDVWLKSSKIALISFVNYPLGIGLNNFEIAHKKFIDQVKVNYIETTKLNIQDASFNLAKIITEFGIFSLLLFYLVIKFTLSEKIDLKYKIFILPNIFTQLLFRGAGYFNGGFIILIIVMTYLILEKDVN